MQRPVLLVSCAPSSVWCCAAVNVQRLLQPCVQRVAYCPAPNVLYRVFCRVQNPMQHPLQRQPSISHASSTGILCSMKHLVLCSVQHPAFPPVLCAASCILSSFQCPPQRLQQSPASYAACSAASSVVLNVLSQIEHPVQRPETSSKSCLMSSIRSSVLSDVELTSPVEFPVQRSACFVTASVICGMCCSVSRPTQRPASRLQRPVSCLAARIRFNDLSYIKLEHAL